jgi:hypothetical protein
MNNEQNFIFKPIQDVTPNADLTKYQTHQNIANTLFNLIKNNNNGISIGLEGSWGSGKSTVVSLLINEFEKDYQIVKENQKERNFYYFYFDAWAHEGDPLRRIFLESLINQIKVQDSGKKEILEKKLIEVSNNIKIVETHTKPNISIFGLLILISTLFVPLGTILLRETLSSLVFYWTGHPHWGFIFITLPLLVIICKAFCDYFAIKFLGVKKKFWTIENWSFINGDKQDTTTYQTSTENERTSVQFEDHFCQILKIIFPLEEYNSKLIIFIDNLDRIDQNVSLSVWSTLQTFFDKINQKNETEPELKKVWVIVPYDETGLMRLWDNKYFHDSNPTKNLKEENQKSEDGSLIEKKSYQNSCSKSYFDKCFQLRLGVPRMVISSWENFFFNKFDEAFQKIDLELDDEKRKNFRDEILDVLKRTRESINDIPTAREIITYINQVGLLRLHCSNVISPEAIAYFVILKYLKFKPYERIENDLVCGYLPEKTLEPFFNSSIKKDLSGILFGVEPEKGIELLLEPVIQQALTDDDSETLTNLFKAHHTAFWTVLNIHINKVLDVKEFNDQIQQITLNRKILEYQDSLTIYMQDYHKIILNYSHSLFVCFRKDDLNECDIYAKKLKVFLEHNIQLLKFPTMDNLVKYESLFKILEYFVFDFTSLWENLIHIIPGLLLQNNITCSDSNSILNTLYDCQKKNPPKAVEIDLLLKNWIEWAFTVKDRKNKDLIFIKPKNNLILNEITGKLNKEIVLLEGTNILIRYIYHCGSSNWSALFECIKNYILNEIMKNNSLPKIINEEVLKVLTELVFIPEITEKVKTFVDEQLKGFIPFIGENTAQQKYYALVFAKADPNLDLNSFAFWNTTNVQNANFAWNYIQEYGCYNLIWSLAQKKSYPLIGEIIKIAYEKNDSIFFKTGNPLENLKSVNNLCNDQQLKSKILIEQINIGCLEQEIKKLDLSNLDTYKNEFDFILGQTKSKKLIDLINKKVSTLKNNN